MSDHRKFNITRNIISSFSIASTCALSFNYNFLIGSAKYVIGKDFKDYFLVKMSALITAV